ncbi:hypothetical protein QCN29_18020 [Streptomyces sp. HNM0663]|uniref:Uncharacterized protein n=1 Tax=Streptomyces chengmaiensis TaxID=3040919 RepID=A0ABT6HPV1_9ACTN|nr:hypothetical protein [Streptomyces chengmaiensis]MDH2390650.1 hypothetical protein [Streptomyces chengmaiensis]
MNRKSYVRDLDQALKLALARHCLFVARALRRDRVLARYLGVVRAFAPVLDLDLDLDDARALVRSLDRVLARVRGLDVVRDLDDARALVRGLDRVLDDARALVRSLDLDRLHHVHDPDLVRELVGVLGSGCRRAEELAVLCADAGFRDAVGEPVRWVSVCARWLTWVALRVVPVAERARYGEEWSCELWELAEGRGRLRRQIAHALRLLSRAWGVRRAVVAYGGWG